jgi:predicted  nucleic acid-binding Zn-ribbon protein
VFSPILFYFEKRSGIMGELSILYELQQAELKLDQLRKNLKELPVFVEFKKLQAQTADAKEAIGWAESKLGEQRKRARRLEMDMDEAEGQSKAIELKLYDGSVNNAKELSQLEEKGKELRRDREKHEETVLISMEAVEELETSLATAKAQHKDKMVKLRALQKSGNEEIQRLKDEIIFHQEQRDILLQQISKELIEGYREKRKRYNGRPLALVTGDTCSGCRVSISSRTKNFLCNPDAVVACDNCGRILVP